MVSAQIFIEGGGDGQLHERTFRKVWCSPPYDKGKVSFDLLAKLNSSCVEAACPHAKELLSRLRTLS